MTLAIGIVGRGLPELAPVLGLPGVTVQGPAPDGVIDGADVILASFASRDALAEALRRSPGARWVHALSAGVDTLLSPALVEHPAVLTNGRGAFSAALGEFAVAALLHFAKDLRRMVAQQGARAWTPFDVEMVEGRRLLVVGYGDIGHAVAVRARALGMQVEAVRRRAGAGDGTVERIWAVADLRTALASADAVVVSAPLTAETRGLLGAAELAALPRHAVLVNVGRGEIVDEPALVEALRSRRLRGAALDVFSTEPLPPDHPFWAMENVLLSPHCADHTPGWKDAAIAVFLANLARFRRGEPLRNVVDKHLGY